MTIAWNKKSCHSNLLCDHASIIGRSLITVLLERFSLSHLKVGGSGPSRPLFIFLPTNLNLDRFFHIHTYNTACNQDFWSKIRVRFWWTRKHSCSPLNTACINDKAQRILFTIFIPSLIASVILWLTALLEYLYLNDCSSY